MPAKNRSLPPLRPDQMPPTEWFVRQHAPHLYSVIRPTVAQLASIPEAYPEYAAFCLAYADQEAEEGFALTKEEWAQRPETYRGHCFKQCYDTVTLRKGSVYEFSVYGVYVCERCGYAYPPDCEPEEE